MSTSRVEISLWSAVAVFGAITMVTARAPRAELHGEVTAAKPRATSTASMMRDIEDAAVSLPETDPFRAARRPSPIAYAPDRVGGPPPPPRAPRPGLSVSGIIGGPPWSAVLEGIPGQQRSTVLHPGDTLGGLRIRAVRRDTVVITGLDTTWRLSVRRTW